MIEWIFAGICIAIGFYLAPIIVSVSAGILVGIYVVLNEVLKAIISIFKRQP